VRSGRAIIGSVLIAFAVVVVAGAFAYDHSRRDTIAEGISVGGIDVGGMKADAARATLRRELLRGLREPVVVAYRGRRFTLTARTARVAVDLDALVAEALARSRDGSIVARVGREVTGGSIDAEIAPHVRYSRAAVAGFVGRVTGALDRPARDASIDFSATQLEPVAARTGVEVLPRRLRRAVVRALRAPTGRAVRPAVRTLAPKVTTGQLAHKYPTIITVDRTNFRLRLWKDLKLVKSYTIAVGRAGLETPAGVYTINDKQVNPSWHVPNSAWAGDLAGKTIPPGPDDPIKARWMAIYNGAGIHGTDELGSLGSAASHGCIRMAIPDVIDLYDRTPLGTTVYIA
jgi:lipoprotein-anchoring transpeptidase ErfK/SrfK